MSETEHSPTPWVLGFDYHRTLIRTGDASTGRRVATTFITGDASAKVNVANAAFIVRAVNSHDALVEALEAALAWIDAVPTDAQLPSMPGFDRDDVDDLLARAKAGAS